MTARAAVCLLAVLSGCNGGKLVAAPDSLCGEPCYDGPAENAGVGTCKRGVTLCYQDGGTSCLGSVLPAAPACNGLDNDCDGVPDAPSQPCYTGPAGTEKVGTCHAGTSTCLAGVWGACVGQVTPQGETCDGKDNDCNGKIDDGVPIELCYSGAAGTMAVGPCRPGYTSCVAGENTCVGQVLPQPETCDGVDNDCNGIVDDGLPKPPEDVVLIVDYSGSMEGERPAVSPYWSEAKLLDAIWGDLAAKYADPLFSFSLIDAPPPAYGQSGTVSIIGTALDAQTLAGAVRQDLSFGVQGSEDEPNLDALAAVCSQANPLGLQWRSGSRRVVLVYSDAVPRSFPADGGAPTQRQDARNVCLAGGYSVSVFTLPAGMADLTNGYPATQWGSIVEPDLGRVYSLYDSEAALVSDVEQIANPLGCR